MLHQLMLLASFRNVLLGFEGLGRPVTKEETHGSVILVFTDYLVITVSFFVYKARFYVYSSS